VRRGRLCGKSSEDDDESDKVEYLEDHKEECTLVGGRKEAQDDTKENSKFWFIVYFLFN
jgi:hypothetical protein